MQKDKIRISAISYLNTLPFLYGIKNSNLLSNYIFELEYPAISAQKLIDNEVDIALIPVAAIPLVNRPFFIADYCIGAFNQVKSVLLLSDVPLKEIKSILLDYQSRTSVNLVQVLAKKYWNIEPKWIKAEKGFENNISDNTAGVIIGDRTFSLNKKYRYVYDLSAEWYKFTSLPFVFAAWVANKEIPSAFIEQFNSALKFGIEHIQDVANEYHLENPASEIDLYAYLTENISFNFDQEKKNSLRLFYQYLSEMQLIPENSDKKINVL
jgi:chorismate dehydratase